jgi:hypothetical protein
MSDAEGLLAESEERTLGAYLELGSFNGLSRSQRLVAFAVAFDLQHAVDVLSIERQCENYDKGQTLFIGAPSLFQSRRKRENERPDLNSSKWKRSHPFQDLKSIKQVTGTAN